MSTVCQTLWLGNRKLGIDTLVVIESSNWAIDRRRASRGRVSTEYKARPHREDRRVSEDDGERVEFGEALVLVVEVSTYFELGLEVRYFGLIVVSGGARQSAYVDQSLRRPPSLARVVVDHIDYIEETVLELDRQQRAEVPRIGSRDNSCILARRIVSRSILVVGENNLATLKMGVINGLFLKGFDQYWLNGNDQPLFALQRAS
jgi:hypothetical protein